MLFWTEDYHNAPSNMLSVHEFQSNIYFKLFMMKIFADLWSHEEENTGGRIIKINKLKIGCDNPGSILFLWKSDCTLSVCLIEILRSRLVFGQDLLICQCIDFHEDKYFVHACLLSRLRFVTWAGGWRGGPGERWGQEMASRMSTYSMLLHSISFHAFTLYFICSCSSSRLFGLQSMLVKTASRKNVQNKFFYKIKETVLTVSSIVFYFFLIIADDEHATEIIDNSLFSYSNT